MSGGYFGSYWPDGYFAGFFGPTEPSDPNAMRGTAAGVATVTGTISSLGGNALIGSAAGVATATGDLGFTGSASTLRGKVRKRRRGKAWDYQRAFAAREAERLQSEPFPIAPQPVPKPLPFTPTQPLLERFAVINPVVSGVRQRPRWTIQDYQAALIEKRRQQEIVERQRRDLEDEELLLLLDAA